MPELMHNQYIQQITYQEKTKPGTSVISIVALADEIIPQCRVHSLVESGNAKT